MPDFLRSAENRAAVIAAIDAWDGAAEDHRVLRGRYAERTAIQDALRRSVLMQSRQLDDAGLVASAKALYGTAEFLAGVAVRCGLDCPDLYLWLRNPDADEGLERARMVVRRLKQMVRDAETAQCSPPSPTTVGPISRVRRLLHPRHRLILSQLDGKARTAKQLRQHPELKNTLYKRGGIKDLTASGQVCQLADLSYYRPDAPPPELADLISEAA